MRNIMLFIDDAAGAEALAQKALKIARQCKANLLLCSVAGNIVSLRALVSHYDEDEVLEPENFDFDISGMARQLQTLQPPASEFASAVSFLGAINFNAASIKETVMRHNIWLIMMDEQQLARIKTAEPGNDALNVINNLNCPVLIMPQYFELSIFNKIAYVTDLRYCDLGVIKFLKVFNAQVFVTHISAPGLPDMEERYAQEILAEEVSVKTNYWKIFLRNIRNKNVKASIDKVLDTLEIKMLALVNKKQQTFERLFDNFPAKTQIYHQLPTLIFPYLNWFNQASFYV